MAKITTTIPAQPSSFDILSDGVVIANARRVEGGYDKPYGSKSTGHKDPYFEVILNGSVQCYANTPARCRHFVDVMTNYKAANVLWYKKTSEYGYRLLVGNIAHYLILVSKHKRNSYFGSNGELIYFPTLEIAQEYISKLVKKRKLKLGETINFKTVNDNWA